MASMGRPPSVTVGRAVAVAVAFVVCGAACAQCYVVAGPEALVAATAPLRALRAAQGLDVSVLVVPADGAPRDVAADLRARVHAAIAAADRPGYLLLVGDADGGGGPTPSLERPGLRDCGPRLERYAGTIWSDLGYVDVDDDGRPEWSCGRLPADSAKEVARIADKIVACERDAGADVPWQRDVALIANAGDFGAVIDAMIEGAVNGMLREDLSPAFRLRAVLGLATSPWHTEPKAFLDAVVDTLNAGPFAAVYAGHGSPRGFAAVQGQPVFRIEDVQRLEHAQRTLLMAFACHIASFPSERCIGEAALAAPGGPCAVIGASAVSMPYGDILLAHELMQALGSRGGSLRVGDLLRTAKAALIADEDDAFHRRGDALAGTLGYEPEHRGKLRRYTADVYHLLGDPAMVFRLPSPLDVALAGDARRGQELAIAVRAPDGEHPGSIRAELCVDRGQVATQDPPDDVLAVKEVPWPGNGGNDPDEVDSVGFAFDLGDLDHRYLVVRVVGVDGSRTWAGGVRFRVSR